MATKDYYNFSRSGRSVRGQDYDAPLPPLPAFSPSYSTPQSPHLPISPHGASPLQENAYTPYTQPSQLSLSSDSAYHGAGQGGRIQDSSSYADDIPLRPHPSKNNSDEWTAQHQPQYRPDDTEGLNGLGTGGKGTRDGKKRRGGFFRGKITWVVYILTLVQTSVFIGELIRNGE